MIHLMRETHLYHLLTCPKNQPKRYATSTPTALPDVLSIHEKLDSAIKEGNLQKIESLNGQLGKFVKTNAASCTTKSETEGNILKTKDLRESPTIMMVQHAYTSDGTKVGILWESASDTNYCMKELAEKLNLQGEPFTLIIHGIAGVQTKIDTMRYKLKLKSRHGIVKLVVYG